MRFYVVILSIYSVAVTVLALLLIMQNRALKQAGQVPLDTRVHVLDLQDVPLNGNPHAKVTLVAYTDFECQFCASGNEALKRLRAEHPDDLRVGFKHLPLPFHAHARDAAAAALAAFRQDRFWPMADQLFARQSELGEPLYRELAEGLGLDMVRFERDRDPLIWEDYLQVQQQEAEQAGVTGTPTYFVNGLKVPGTSYQALREAVDLALSQH